MADSDTIDLDSLIEQLHISLRERTIRGLLVGNDTGCFTVEQYTDAYLKHQKVDDQYKDGFRRWFLSGLAERHLNGSPSVQAVKPGVWSGKVDNRDEWLAL